MGESLHDYCVRMKTTDILRQWHPTKNADLTSAEVSYGSQRKVWWQCEKGHEWQSMVKTRAMGSGCPVCANRVLVQGENDLATTRPDLAAQWHPAKNGGLTPRDVMAGTSRKVWWRCGSGHAWQARINSRSAGAGCPVCTGKQTIPGKTDLAALYPEIAAQWDEEKNGGLRPCDVSPCSNRRVWWRCELGHGYRAPVSHRTMRKSGCPYCAGTKVLQGFNDLATAEPAVAKQWHPTLNAPLTPLDVTAGSHRKIWWQCEQGHVWRAMLYSRTGPKRCGCPVCAGVSKTVQHRRYAVPAEQGTGARL